MIITHRNSYTRVKLKMFSKLIKDQNIKSKLVKFLREVRGRLYDIRIDNNFKDVMPQTVKKRKNWKK